MASGRFLCMAALTLLSDFAYGTGFTHGDWSTFPVIGINGSAGSEIAHIIVTAGDENEVEVLFDGSTASAHASDSKVSAYYHKTDSIVEVKDATCSYATNKLTCATLDSSGTFQGVSTETGIFKLTKLTMGNGGTFKFDTSAAVATIDTSKTIAINTLTYTDTTAGSETLFIKYTPVTQIEVGSSAVYINVIFLQTDCTGKVDDFTPRDAADPSADSYSGTVATYASGADTTELAKDTSIDAGKFVYKKAGATGGVSKAVHTIQVGNHVAAEAANYITLPVKIPQGTYSVFMTSTAGHYTTTHNPLQVGTVESCDFAVRSLGVIGAGLVAAVAMLLN